MTKNPTLTAGRPFAVAAMLALGMALPAAPLAAKEKDRWEYDGKYYTSYESCKAARKKAEKKGAIIGAVGGAATTAIFGGNVGKAALASGVGALAGSQIGKASKKC